MPDFQLLAGEVINFKSSRPVELVNNSNRPTRISKKLGKYWVYVTNLRVVFCSDSVKKSFSEAFENIDYYSLFETKSDFLTKYREEIDRYSLYNTKSAFATKHRIRVWIGLTRLDLIGDKKTLEEILGEFRTRIQLKFKKGAEIITHVNGEEFQMFRDIENMAKERNVSLADVLEKGTFSFKIDNAWAFKMKQSEYYKTGRTIWENEENWNLTDLPDGSIKVTLIPAIPFTHETKIVKKS